MRENLCTIPINKILEEQNGCPVCAMRDIIESRMIDYTLGDSMMEPDTRIITNKLGFCDKHLIKLKSGKNRLALALMLRTHLDELEKSVLSGGMFSSMKKSAATADEILKTCFVCDGIERNMSQLLDTFFKSYNADSHFRESYKNQEFLCFPHMALLLKNAEQKLDKSRKKEFFDVTKSLTLKYLEPLKSDLDKFTKMFDYRTDSNSQEFQSAKNAIESAYYFLYGEELK